MTAYCDEIFNTSGLGFQKTSGSAIATGKTGYPNVHIFLMKNIMRTDIPKSSCRKFDLRIKILYKKINTGSQIMVGFIAKTKMENAKRKVVFLFPAIASFKITKEKIMTGRSGLGDCENNSRTGKKHRCIQCFLSIL